MWEECVMTSNEISHNDHFTIYALYEGFFTFLTKKRGAAWSAFRSHYTSQAPDFFEAYFSGFSYNTSTLKYRVEVTAPEHYAHLRALVRRNPPKVIVSNALKRCRALIPMEQVHVYLMIGFFSADGFTLIIDGNPVIGIGLERLRDFSYLDLLVAHEYAHCLRIRNGFLSRNRSLSILNEGIASHFSQAAFPERTLPEHLFLSNAAFNHLLGQKDELLSSFFHPPATCNKHEHSGLKRTKQFLGYFAINEYCRGKEKFSLHKLLSLDLTDVFPGDT